MNIESLQLELSKSLLNKKIIYFDTKFWIYMRDSILYPEKECFREYSKLLKISESLVKNGISVFPISQDILIEVMKQTDINTRRQTCEIIEKLSNGIAIINYDERVKWEIKKLLEQSNKNISEITKPVWTKLACMMNANSRMPNFIWDISLLELLETIESIKIDPYMDKFKQDICRLTNEKNAGKHLYSNDFQKNYKIEIASIIKADIYYSIKQLCSTPLSPQEIDQLQGLIYTVCITSTKFDKELPSLRIGAGLSAAVMLDKKRNFNNNDWYDFNHAIAALPYADYFFTEKSLSHLIKQKLLSFDKAYHCVVESKVENVISLLQNLDNLK